MERTFVAIKPDGVQRALTGKIISRFEEKGYKIIGLKMLNVSEELAAKHYEEHIGKPFYDSLVKYICSGPIIGIVLEGENVIAGARQLMGATNPNNADVGTIRADFAVTMSNNIIHGSDGVQSAEREINLYFKPEEICANWKTILEIFAERL